MSYMLCPKCGEANGMVGMTLFQCACARSKEADRPAPSGEAKADARAPQEGEDSFALTSRIERECHKAFDGICSSFATSHCEELISAHDTAIRAAERNRARREAVEEAANLVENSVDENTAGILTIRNDIGDKIRALAAAPPQAGEDDLAQAREFWKTLPHCCGYPQCDGDLVGIEHDSKCPLYGKKELTLLEFAAMFGAAERNRARREALELADATESLLHTMLSARTFAQRERVAKAIEAIRALATDTQ